ncbi:MAG TPA: hypothetical protein VJY62_02415 [Bacteroidia bacterium]|nr:hypothetical protein [Bacteroidia bacterium]
MIQDLLITKDNFEPYKPITKFVSDIVKLQPFILEAQLFDLSPLLSDEDLMLLDIIDHHASTDTDNKALLEYIIPALVYYSYARYLVSDGIHSTASGLVKKKNEFSTGLDKDEKADLISQAQSGAYAFADRMIKFIVKTKTADSSKFPLYKPITTLKSRMRINAIGGNDCKIDPAEMWKYKY